MFVCPCAFSHIQNFSIRNVILISIYKTTDSLLLGVTSKKTWEDRQVGQQTGKLVRQTDRQTDGYNSHSAVCFQQLLYSQRKLWCYCFGQPHSPPPLSITLKTQNTHTITIYYSFYSPKQFEYIKQAGGSVCVSIRFSCREAGGKTNWESLSACSRLGNHYTWMFECTH